MKYIQYIFSTILLLSTFNATAQTINWKALQKEQKHIASVNIGVDYAFTYSAGYGYKLTSKRPIILNASFSLPSGENIADDYKTKIGGQINWLKSGNFYFSSKLHGIFRRFENSYARLVNFGADISTTVGYYKQHWFVATDAGFDKAIITHFKHSNLYKENFPAVKDGWYEPATGGNFYYGLQGGYSIKKADIYLRAGKLIEQDFQTSPILPFYAELGFAFKIKQQ
jgi:hypothetical protein